MKRILSLSLIVFQFTLSTAQTLDECQQAAAQNYPLIRQYGLIEQTAQLTVSNISKGWLPQISATAQATLQSDVTAWPDQMQTMLSGMGVNIAGLKKDQYRVGVDVNQLIWDGGVLRSQQEIARQQSAVETAQVEASLYQVRQRVNEMYFALLLADEQIQLNRDLQALLSSNEQKLATMFQHGTAAESDYLNVKAERLNAEQQLTSLQAQRQTVALMLSALCGINVSQPVKPTPQAAATAGTVNMRPELKAIDAQLRLTDAQEQGLNTALMPKLSVFAQGFYGYPGLNMFDDMMHHSWSLNGIIGARLTWNIGALYTRKNDRTRLNAQREMFNVQREVFLFNNRLEQLQQNENMKRYRQLTAADEEIISLRAAVRKAAESKLQHGIIDVNDLLREINSENAARQQQAIHELEMLKEMYNLKYTTGEK